MTLRCWKIAAAVTAAGALVAGCAGDDKSEDKLDVGVLIITMFDPEHQAWLSRESLPISVKLPTVDKPVQCNSDGLCVIETGQGKSNAATTMTAVLSSPKFDFSRAYFLTTGIAGTPPDQGTLGSAAWARWVVDFDLGNHLDPTEAPEVPFGFRPVEKYDTAAYHLDDALVDTAFRLTEKTRLADSDAAAAERAAYPEQVGRTPSVMKCDTMTGDDYFSGKQPSDTARHIMDVRTQGEGTYCTTQMEDNATATALSRHGYLNRYLSLRTISNFDQPHPGQTVVQHLDATGDGFRLALENLYTLGRQVADHLLRNRPPSR
ncbi:purine nucleoside permease [Nocardia sp. XZ_19_385]|uniref:purine-nucleoside phosphorylase n=1 Tax=Nocardia sp. XZ_19_385 TaxID=2769488 RepID=UPI00188E0AF2|nr:purine nucleoside permease [Nocardia sp. XZ_19_385]